MSMYEAEKGNRYLNTMAKILLALAFLVLLHKLMMSFPLLGRPSVALLRGWAQSGWVVVAFSFTAMMLLWASGTTMHEDDEPDLQLFWTSMLALVIFVISLVCMIVYGIRYGFG